MRSIVVASLLFLASSWSAFGKAYFYTQSELIQKAEVIAVIDIAEPGEVPEKIEEYKQQASVQVVKILKGQVPKEFTLYGNGSFICAQCILSKGRFLAFLSKDGELWIGTNWQLSLRPIRGGEVEWYVSNEQRFPMTFQKLDKVVAEIEAVLKKASSDQAVVPDGSVQPSEKASSPDEGQAE